MSKSQKKTVNVFLLTEKNSYFVRKDILKN